MSLLTDPSYLIYQMRLALINNDQTAKKVVTLPIYSEDDYLVYSNSPEDTNYSTSPNITMIGSNEGYQSKKGKSPYSPYINTMPSRSQQQQQQPQQIYNYYTQQQKQLKAQKSSQTINSTNTSNVTLKDINSKSKSVDQLQVTQQQQAEEKLKKVGSNENDKEKEESNSCRSTDSLQLEDEEEAQYDNSSLSSSNGSSQTATPAEEVHETHVINENLFIKQKNLLTLDSSRSLPAWKPLVSNLSQLIQQNNSSSNPFSEYRFFCGKGDLDFMELLIYLPFSNEPTKPLQIKVKKTATVEDVIGYSLYEYNEKNRKPPITLESYDVPYWNMRIVEDDGEIDEDFPALERGRKIQKFAFDSFAICKASPSEISKNLAVRNAKKAKSNNNITEINNDNLGSISSTKTYFIRVNLYSTLEVKQTTTLQFPSNMLLRDVFKNICQKRKYDIKDYVLKMADTKTDVPLDKTLEQAKLQEICVLKRDRGGAGDIFLRPPDEKDNAAMDALNLGQDDYSSIYKQWTVSYRHFMGRSECILIIDGEYIYITSNENKFLKKTSYHIGSVEMCRTHHKNNSIIKFIIKRAHDTKSYEFEAASSQEAEEICLKIKILNEKIKRENNS